MPVFIHQPLLWGLLIAGLPVLIHLINMMRHRRVPWAAMEFLLVSQKKNRTWVLFKQLLLLLLRMAILATLVLVVAQPLLRSPWGRWLGGIRVHHVVLLDDSFSMSDRWAATSAIDEAKAAIQLIGAEAARQVHPQQFTLLRFSRAGRVGRNSQPDMLRETVDTQFATRLHEALNKITVSQTAAGPHEALESVDQLLGPADDEHRIVYLVSDFRARQWDDSGDLRKQLLHVSQSHADLELVNCVDAVHQNLAIASLAPAEGTRAAGVPLFVELAVENFGPRVAKNVAVTLEEDGRARPGVTIAQVPVGKTIKERFLVNFPTAGQHVVTARLESDAVAADNFRYCVIDLPATLPVLLVDGDPDAHDAHFLSTALAPGGPVRTGLSPRIEAPRFLSLHPLDAYRAIYLLNFDRLDRAAIVALEAYLNAGGGVGLFLGERCQSRFINDELYRGGRGFFPLPLGRPADLAVDRLQQAPDLNVADHPIFRIFAGQRNSFLATVTVERYFSVPKPWKPNPDSTTRVIAQLRNGAPLAVERRFGQGRVVAFLTTAAPIWNNWARNNPSFVIAMQEMQAYLAGQGLAEAVRLVGAPLRVELDPSQYQPQVRFVTPQENALPAASTDALPTAGGPLAAQLPETEASGIYEAQLLKADGGREIRRYAVNVDAAEGDLRTLSAAQLGVHLAGVRYTYAQAANYRAAETTIAGVNLSQTLLYALILLLIVEQMLAYSASYHPPAARRMAAKGGAWGTGPFSGSRTHSAGERGAENMDLSPSKAKGGVR